MGNDMFEEVDVLKKVKEIRVKALDRSVELYDVCNEDCNMLPKGFTVDRDNEICDACPIQKGLLDVRKVLDVTLEDIRMLRK